MKGIEIIYEDYEDVVKFIKSIFWGDNPASDFEINIRKEDGRFSIWIGDLI